MNNKHMTIEEALERALQLFEEGKTPEEIYALLPGHSQDLKEYFSVIASLNKSKNSLKPRPEILVKALDEAVRPAWRRRAFIIPCAAMAVFLLLVGIVHVIPGKELYVKNDPQANKEIEESVQALSDPATFDLPAELAEEEDPSFDEVQAALDGLANFYDTYEESF